MNNLARAMAWREGVATGELIESRWYARTHLSYPNSISQNELNTICDLANKYWASIGKDLRINNSMGEILAYFSERA
jgi:hypothetical protein